jgi:predicted permease
LRSALVAAQVALSVVLLSGAGLMLRTLWSLETTRVGLDPDHVVTARFVLGQAKWGNGPAAQVTFFHELERQLREIPGVTAAAVTDSLPPTGGTRSRPYSTIEIEGRPALPEGSGGMVPWRYVTRGYFQALGIPLRRGRLFLPEGAEIANPMILSETMARRMFPAGDALGQRLLKTPKGEWHEVVGVVGDVRNRGIERQAEPEFYILRRSVPDHNFANAEPPIGWRAAVAVIRTPVSPAIAAAQLREALQRIDSTLPVTIEAMPERLRGVTQRPRFHAWLLGLFAAAGLALAAIGLYGVMSYLVAQREREMGVRLALGATPGDLQRLVLAQAGRWLATGLAVGAALAFAAARAARSLLYGVSPEDPWTWSAAVALLLLTGLAAAAAPAWRASRVEASVALRQE